MKEMLNLSQQDYVSRIDELNQVSYLIILVDRIMIFSFFENFLTEPSG